MVVPVARDDAGAEGGDLRLEALEREDLLGRLVRLELVPVDDDEQPPDALVRGRLQRLPVLTLLQLAVAGHHDDAAAAPEVALAQAIPRAFEIPIPSEPEFASIPGTPTSGCPSRPPSLRSRSSRSVGTTPSALSAA